MQRLKSAIKKMAAISTGIVMLGATITSAIAMDLSEYPSPFVSTEGLFDDSTAIVVGSKAASADTLGAIQIATNLQYMAKTPVSSAGGGISVVGGESNDIPINKGIADTNVGLDWQIQDNDVSSFQDTKITFKGKSYNIHDEVDLSTASPSIETSLTSADDDYETAVVAEVARDAIKYYYVFDEAINASKATSTDPLEIKFLGKTLKITSIDSAGNKFTAYVGNEYFMKVGDTVTVDGKKVTLSNVGIGGAIVIDVDGTVETISADSTKTINGIEISNDETFYEDTKSERAASLVVGVDAKETYGDGDAYVGEDENDPNWVWNMENLGLESSTTVVGITDTGNSGPILGIENDFVMNDDSDNPPQAGDCIDLPNIYASICFDSLTVADDKYATYTFEYESDTDLSEVNSVYTSVPTIYIHTAVTEGLILDRSAFINLHDLNATYGNTDKKANKMWLTTANISSSANWASDLNSNNITVMYEDSDGKTRIFGKLNSTLSTTVGSQFAQINFGDTTGKNINISIAGEGALDMVNLTLSPEGDNADELTSASDLIIMQFAIGASGNYSGLTTVGSADVADLIWGTYTGTTSIQIGQKDEDHRTIYGIIIRDPKNHGASDEVILEIPEDQVQANVVVKGASTTVAGGATTYIPAEITIDTKLDTEVADPTAHNLILVGGPCAGGGFPMAANIITCEDFRNRFKPGEALLKLVKNGDTKLALLVAGYDAIDTRMAAKVLANFNDYKLETTEQVVTGSLAAPMIKVS